MIKSTDELKFLLTLLGAPNYRSPLNAKRFNSFKSKNSLCKSLGDRNLVDFSREISAVKILPPGLALLKVDPEQVPMTDKERKILEKLAKSGKVAPSQIKVSSVKASEREAVLLGLSERGLVGTELNLRRNKAEVWLSDRGIQFLRNDYNSKGAGNISLELLGHYVSFLRKSVPSTADLADPALTPLGENDNSSPATSQDLSDEAILKTIRDLDYELGTDNYLPIFHLRQQLQPSLSREQLDQALYRLQHSDKIELSSLVDPTPYSDAQIAAGISQAVGGPLFFIAVN
jgi:hypothetical protein